MTTNLSDDVVADLDTAGVLDGPLPSELEGDGRPVLADDGLVFRQLLRKDETRAGEHLRAADGLSQGVDQLAAEPGKKTGKSFEETIFLWLKSPLSTLYLARKKEKDIPGKTFKRPD